MRAELATLAARMPESAEPAWRSAAQRRFRARVDDLTASMRTAIGALDRALDELARVRAACRAQAEEE